MVSTIAIAPTQPTIKETYLSTEEINNKFKVLRQEILQQVSRRYDTLENKMTKEIEDTKREFKNDIKHINEHLEKLSLKIDRTLESQTAALKEELDSNNRKLTETIQNMFVNMSKLAIPNVMDKEVDNRQHRNESLSDPLGHFATPDQNNV